MDTPFSNLKTRGVNLENTHLTNGINLATLSTVRALAIRPCVKTGAASARIRPVLVKKHGCKACSILASGLGVLPQTGATGDIRQTTRIPKHLLFPKRSIDPLRAPPA